MCSEAFQQNNICNSNMLSPDENDEKYVFCGRGNVNANRPGNMKFSQIIQSNMKDYIKAETKMAKVIVVTSVVNFIREAGMKFVTFDKSTKRYMELSPDRLHTKVSHAIRDQIKQNEKDEKFIAKTKLLLAERQKRAVTNILSAGSSSKPVVGRNTIDSIAILRGNKRNNKRISITTPSSSGKNRMYDEEGFDDWWAKQKKACFEKLLWPTQPVPKNYSPSQECTRSSLDTVSRTIFDLGATIDGGTSSTLGTRSNSICAKEESDWNVAIQQLLRKEDVTATPPPSPNSPYDKMEVSKLESIQKNGTVSSIETLSSPPSKSSLVVPHWLLVSPPSPPAAVHEEFSPLPVDAEPQFSSEDVERLSLILLNGSCYREDEQEGEVSPHLQMTADDQCVPNQHHETGYSNVMF